MYSSVHGVCIPQRWRKDLRWPPLFVPGLRAWIAACLCWNKSMFFMTTYLSAVKNLAFSSSLKSRSADYLHLVLGRSGMHATTADNLLWHLKQLADSHEAGNLNSTLYHNKQNNVCHVTTYRQDVSVVLRNAGSPGIHHGLVANWAQLSNLGEWNVSMKYMVVHSWENRRFSLTSFFMRLQWNIYI